MALCQDERDAALRLRRVRNTGTAFAIRSGGHTSRASVAVLGW
jgi:hypothetical protein